MTYIHLKLEYAARVWSLHLWNHKELLKRVQINALRMVPDVSGMSCKERRKVLDLPTLDGCRMVHMIPYNFLRSHDDGNMKQFFEVRRESREGIIGR